MDLFVEVHGGLGLLRLLQAAEGLKLSQPIVSM